MNNSMGHPRLIYLLAWITFTLLLPKVAAGQQAKAQDQTVACAISGLPDNLQKKLGAQFASWKIQELRDLSPSASVRWSSADYTGCPGVAVGEFREKRRQSQAVLLVPRDKPDSAYRFVIYSAGSESSAEEFTVVEKRDRAGAANFFLNASHLDELFDEQARRKAHMGAKDAVLLFDAGETEYEVDAYFWAEASYRNTPVDL